MILTRCVNCILKVLNSLTKHNSRPGGYEGRKEANMKSNFFDFGDELARAYRVLSAEQAEMQNHRDIREWQKQGLITSEEAKELNVLNFKLARTYR